MTIVLTNDNVPFDFSARIDLLRTLTIEWNQVNYIKTYTQTLSDEIIPNNPINIYSSSEMGTTNYRAQFCNTHSLRTTAPGSYTWAFICIAKTKWNIAEWSRTKKNRAKPHAGMQYACIAGDTWRTRITHRFSHCDRRLLMRKRGKQLTVCENSHSNAQPISTE